MTHRVKEIMSFCGLILIWGLSWEAKAATDGFVVDIKNTSLAQLMNFKITSLSLKSESLRRAPAAVYVITRDDIQRMGVTHIAEALRYVPGVEVNRREAGKWNVGIRGFGSTTTNANKMLVLIDGRSIYSTLFSGVLWEEKDVLLEDVDRIEVIRGPGSTIWGANAVNGVINIITRNSKDTLGGVVTGGAGLEEEGLVQGRYGWKIGKDSYARIYSKYVERDNSGGIGAVDNSDHRQAGFRSDLALSDADRVTVQGDYYEGVNGTGFQGFLVGNGEDYSGGNLLLNWAHRDTPNQVQRLLLYYDNTQLNNSALKDSRDIVNVEYVLNHKLDRHDIVAGAGYRTVSDEVTGGNQFYLDPIKRKDQVSSAFIQDEIQPFGTEFRVIVGTKYEVNDYSGEEWQPSIRLAYDLNDAVIWTAWSRAVRVPTRLEHDFIIPLNMTSGQQNLDPEYASFYEAGWRKTWSQWQLDLATYIGRYTDLRTTEGSTLGNNMSGDIAGVELSASYQPLAQWRLTLNVTHSELDLTRNTASLDTQPIGAYEDSSPKNLLELISYWDINSHWQLNTFLRYVDAIQYSDLPSYLVMDFSLVWLVHKDVRLQLVGRHLGDEHLEADSVNGTVEPDAALYLSWEF